MSWVNFEKTQLDETQFINCALQNAFFSDAEIQNSTFKKSSIISSTFGGAHLCNTKFHSSNVIFSAFEDTRLENCKFVGCNLSGTHFLNARVTEGVIEKSNLENALFFDLELFFRIDAQSSMTNKITKPVTAFVCPNKKRGQSVPRAYQKLLISGVIPILVSAYGQRVDLKQLEKEAEITFRDFDGSKDSIPLYHLSKAKDDPETFFYSYNHYVKAKILAKHVDGFVLPGDDSNIPSEWSGIKGQVMDQMSLNRSIFEFMLIDQAIAKGIPFLGLCRGHQAVALYHGEKLEDVKGHDVTVQTIALHKYGNSGLIPGILKQNFADIRMASDHHQAVVLSNSNGDFKRKYIGNLEVIADHSGVLKALESKYGAASPMISLQVHPEFYSRYPFGDSFARAFIDLGMQIVLDRENDLFWKVWQQSTLAHRAKKVMNRAFLPNEKWVK